MKGMLLSLRFLATAHVQYRTDRAAKAGAGVLERARHMRWFLWITHATLLLYVLSAPEARAFSLFDDIVNQTNSEGRNWMATILGLMKNTFMLLAVLEMCWAATIWAFEKDSLNSLSAELIKKLMAHGFYYFLLLNAPTWVPAIVGSFAYAGQQAAGISPGTISTDGIIQMGLDVIGKMWASVLASVMPVIAFDPEVIMGEANPVAWAALVSGGVTLLLAAVASVVVAIAYVVVAAQYFCLQIETSVLFAAGAIFLGFGGSDWTREYVKKYLDYTLSAGLRMLVLLLILSLTLTKVNQMASSMTFTFGIFFADIKPLLGIIAAALLQAIVGIKAPDMAAALMSGSSGLTAGGIVQSMAQLRMAGMGGGLGGVAGGAASAAKSGLTHALKAAEGTRVGGAISRGAHGVASALGLGGHSGSSVNGLSGHTGSGDGGRPRGRGAGSSSHGVSESEGASASHVRSGSRSGFQSSVPGSGGTGADSPSAPQGSGGSGSATPVPQGLSVGADSSGERPLRRAASRRSLAWMDDPPADPPIEQRNP